MQNQKKAGQAEDWELSEEYYREDTGNLRSSWRAWQTG